MIITLNCLFKGRILDFMTSEEIYWQYFGFWLLVRTPTQSNLRECEPETQVPVGFEALIAPFCSAGPPVPFPFQPS